MKISSLLLSFYGIVGADSEMTAFLLFRSLFHIQQKMNNLTNPPPLYHLGCLEVKTKPCAFFQMCIQQKVTGNQHFQEQHKLK